MRDVCTHDMMKGGVIITKGFWNGMTSASRRMLTCQHWRVLSPYDVRSMMSPISHSVAVVGGPAHRPKHCLLFLQLVWFTVKAQEKQGRAPRQEYNEIAVGGCCRNEKLQQYLENDRRVLRFQTFWDENGKYGSRKFPGQIFAPVYHWFR